MGILHRILPRVSVLSAAYREGGGYALSWYVARYKKGEAEVEKEGEADASGAIPEEIGRYPLLVLVGGHGVIAKEVEANGKIIGQITAHPENFLWTFSDGDRHISFVRRTQLDGLLQELEKARLVPLQISCGSADLNNHYMAAMRLAADFARRQLTLKNSVRPTREGSTLAMLLFNKLKLPVLAIILLALLGNVLIGNSLREKYQAQQARLRTLQTDRQKDGDRQTLNRQLLAQMSWTLPYRFAWLLDRSAAAVPEKIQLDRLSVQPIRKALEQGIPPMIFEKTMVIHGEAASSDEISKYVTALSAQPFGKGLKLSSVERDPDTGLFEFKIDLTL